ncbi:CoA transferase [Sphingomonas pokkalii]|uniref:CoA transferase n=2 Tax=Sphingomonas pokkalii TaxID=2175090 RepID=A0A2U0SH56_9SPHN|nr:CoA transferase [Sphingomonas pokkalii]
MRLPLAGVRILSVEQYGAGPYGTMLLAQLGAEVIKIETPGAGDTARSVGPHFLREKESLFFQTFNLNKRSLTLDIDCAEGRAVLHRLAAGAHAVANNLRGDLPERLGLTYARLAVANPAIVCAHLSAYGRDNSRATWPGYDYLMQAEAGYLSMTGEPDGPPVRFGLSMVDFMTGSMMCVGLLAALLDAAKTGAGRDVDVDLLSTALHQTSYPATWYLNEGDVTGRAPRSAHPSVVPSQLFRARDGWLFVMAQMPKFWLRLIGTMGCAEMAEDPRFASPKARLANRQVLTELLEARFQTATVAEWVDRLAGAVPVAPVYDLAGALDNPFLAETAMIDTVAHVDRADLRVLANPIRLDGDRLPARAAPLLGGDTDAVLAEAGFDTAEIAALRAGGVL